VSGSTLTDSLDGDPVGEWYSPAIPAAQLRNLMKRCDRHAALNFGCWLLLCLASGAGVVAAIGTYWIVPAVCVYGILLSFSYAASHECSHGTAFRTRWLNEVVFWLTSVIFMEEAVYRRYAHAEHHTHTWFNTEDPQKPYGIPLSAWQYLKETLLLTFYQQAFHRLLRHALGRFTAHERQFLPEPERKRVRLDSILMLACYCGLLAWGVVARSPWPFVLYFIPRYIGGCFVNLYINTQHMGMAEDLKDHRLTTRSFRATRWERLLYWNMNYHIEHHLFPGVPFHALPRLNAAIAGELPPAGRSVWSINAGIVRTILRPRGGSSSATTAAS